MSTFKKLLHLTTCLKEPSGVAELARRIDSQDRSFAARRERMIKMLARRRPR